MSKRTGTLAIGLAVIGLAATSMPVNAAFEIRKSQAVPAESHEAVFDQSQFNIWVDNTYEAVIQYGRRPMLEPDATYGDKMPLSDALKILTPDGWLAHRAKDLDLDGRLMVSWDLKSATWVDVLRNLGERHGFQFHVDHNRHEIYIKNGKKLIFDRPEKLGIEESYPSATAKRVFDRNPKLSDRSITSVPAPQIKALSPTSVNLNKDALNNSAFTLNKGDDAQSVMEDLATIFGYKRLVWMMPDLQVHKTQTFTGDATQIMAEVVSNFDGRMCLYEVDMTAAVIPTSMECPK